MIILRKYAIFVMAKSIHIYKMIILRQYIAIAHVKIGPTA